MRSRFLPRRTGLTVGVLATLVLCPAMSLSHDECAIPPLVAATRPGPDEFPTAVRVGVYVIDVTHIREVEKTFTGDVNFTLRWGDPRLSAATLGRSLAGCHLGLEDIWDPAVFIVNLRNADRIDSPFLSVDESGNVLYRERFYGTLTAPLDLHDFPFDQQILPITTVAEAPPTRWFCWPIRPAWGWWTGLPSQDGPCCTAL